MYQISTYWSNLNEFYIETLWFYCSSPLADESVFGNEFGIELNVYPKSVDHHHLRQLTLYNPLKWCTNITIDSGLVKEKISSHNCRLSPFSYQRKRSLMSSFHSSDRVISNSWYISSIRTMWILCPFPF